MTEPRIGVYICYCGSNIAGTVDVLDVAKSAEGLDGVVVSRAYHFMCSDPGQEMIKKDIREYGLNRVVVAACSPTMHEPTYRRVMQDAGLNPYFFEMANIREHCSWAHLDNWDRTTQKAKDIVKTAVARARFLRPQTEAEIPVLKEMLVIGGGDLLIRAAEASVSIGKLKKGMVYFKKAVEDLNNYSECETCN